jgi:hypothetical protein
MTLRRLRLGSLCLALAAAGCALGTQRFGREIDETRISSLEVGVSTKADVLATFGPPTAYSHLPVADDEEERRKRERGRELEPESEPPPDAFVYEYREDRESFFTVLLFTRFHREVLTDRLLVFFDEQEVVRHVAFERETGE